MLCKVPWGVFAQASLPFAPWFRLPGKAGGAAGRHKEAPEETVLPRRGHHVTDGIIPVNLLTVQSLPCHAKRAITRPCLQPGLLLPPQMEQAAKSVSRHSSRGPAVLTPTHRGSQPRATPSPAPRGPSWNKLLPNAWL